MTVEQDWSGLVQQGRTTLGMTRCDKESFGATAQG